MTTSNSDNLKDGSKRTSNTISFSLAYPWSQRLTLQVWGSQIASANDSLTAPSDSSTLNMNLEATRMFTDRTTWTLGLGRNQTADTITPANDLSETILTVRMSYSF